MSDNKISKTWRIDPGVFKRATEVAEERGCTVTELVEQGLRLVCDGKTIEMRDLEARCDRLERILDEIETRAGEHKKNRRRRH